MSGRRNQFSYRLSKFHIYFYGISKNRIVPILGKNTLLSFWEHKGWCQGRDYVVVGAGFVGLSAALECRQKFPDASITIVELSPLCGGGSTKNAGFACFGSPSELMDDWETLGPEKTVELVASRYNGLRKLRKNYKDSVIGYEPSGSIELFTSDNSELESKVSKFIPTLNKALEGVFGCDAFQIVDSANGVTGSRSLVYSPLEGILDTSKLYREMLQRALTSGIDIVNGCKIESIEEVSGGYILDFDYGYFEAREVMIAANAFAADLLPDLDVVPQTNRVLVTEQINTLEFSGSCHYDRGYVYLRRLENRILIGGGRQWGDGASEDVQQMLQDFIAKHIKGAEGAKIEYNWLGHLGVGASREPIVKTIKPGLHVGVRMGGMGVAIGTVIGSQLGGLTKA